LVQLLAMAEWLWLSGLASAEWLWLTGLGSAVGYG